MSIATFRDLRNETARQLNALLALHSETREVEGKGFEGMAADIAHLSTALATLDKRFCEKSNLP